MSCDSCLFYKVARCLKCPSYPRSQIISHPCRQTWHLIFPIGSPGELRKASTPFPHNYHPEFCTLLPFVLKTYPHEQCFMEMCKLLFLFDLIFLYQWPSVCDSPLLSYRGLQIPKLQRGSCDVLSLQHNQTLMSSMVMPISAWSYGCSLTHSRKAWTKL